MNINQVLSIFDWDLKKIYKHTKVPDIFISEFGNYLTYLTIIDKEETDIIFNNVTSEVIFIDLQRHTYIENMNQHIIKEYKFYFENIISEHEMLNILCDINKKEHDAILDLTIDNDALTVIDNSADKLNISRQQFIAKVLIDKILENKNV